MAEAPKIESSFADIISEDRETRTKKDWSGTFIEYLDIVKENPEVAKLAHKRIFTRIMRDGTTKVHDIDNPRIKRLFKNENVRVYNFFKDKFFGLERTINQIVRYFHSASLKGEESRQVLYLVGPVGSGKSSLVEHIKEGLEQNGPLFALDGCPIHEEPLHLLPRHLRARFEELLGIKIEGDLCPVCRHRLAEEFDNRYEEFPVVTKGFSRRARIGIGVVPPVDPNNQDTSVLIGSEDLSKLDKFGEGDPRVLDLNGALDVGNRGIVEFIEVFKNETEYLHAMITATQEKMIPAPGRHGMIYLDTCILAHSNEAEWKKFKADHTNEAILDRIVTVKVPYNLELSEEVKIYKKILSMSTFDAHIAPHTIEIASMFAILTRLAKTNKCDPMTKLKIYNGEEVVEKGRTKKVSVDELREEARDEGMNGISTRFVMKALDNSLSDHSEGNCINPIYVLESLVNMVKAKDFPDEVKKEYLELLRDTLHKEYLEILEKEITRAFVYSFKEQAENLFQNYLDHAEAFVNRTKVKDSNTGEELEPDIKYLESIEEEIGIVGTAAPGFRQEVIAFLWSATRRGEKLDYTCYEPLKEALEKKLMSSVRDLSRVITKSRTRNQQQEKKYHAMTQAMIDNGYCEQCVDVVLKYAANNLWKD
jgi:serine protein kinase